MSNGFFYLNSSSPGAPQLNNTAGCIVNILDWALDVDGGTRGWEKVYDNAANVRVYRPTTGIRPFIKVSDNQINFAYLRMYDNMTDISTGTGACPNGSPQSTSYCNALKAAQAGNHTYYIVGDGRWFFFMANVDNQYTYKNMIQFFFGEFPSYDPLDSYNFILSGAPSPTAPWYYTTKKTMFSGALANYPLNGQSPDGNNPGTFCLKSPDGLIESSASALYDPFFVLRDGFRQAGVAHFGQSPALVYQPYYIVDSNGSSGTWNQLFACGGSNAYFRGTLPYVYSTPFAGFTGAVNGAQVTDGISTFVTLDFVGDSVSNNTVEYIKVMMLRDSNDEPGRDFVI